MELHYSQTCKLIDCTDDSFTTLWNYTILKQIPVNRFPRMVLLPYGITLFSNVGSRYQICVKVLLPYGITLFSNLKPQIKCAHYYAHGNSIGYFNHTMFTAHCQQFRTNHCRYTLRFLFQLRIKSCFLYLIFSNRQSVPLLTVL